jgi:UDP-N-acetylglucosamine 2-epimerase
VLQSADADRASAIMTGSLQHVCVVLGSRPEVIKMAPVVRALRARPDVFHATLCATGQHEHLVPEALAEFDLTPDVDLHVMRPNQTLAGLTARLMTRLDGTFVDLAPDWLLVQGDTTSAMVASLAGFYRGIRVGHVEAGMRTACKRAPYPEEMNRRIITQCADLHFAPTTRCRTHLLAEGVPPSAVFVTGNTGIDAVVWTRDSIRREPPALPIGWLDALEARRLILVTSHRRESFGAGLEAICLSISDLAARHEDIVVVFPVHPNPNVASLVTRHLASRPRVLLANPLPYRLQVAMMDRAFLLLTDSGGIQEEAPGLGKPVVVMRDVTERTEGIESGGALLVGTDRQRIVGAVDRLLRDDSMYRAMAQVRWPYGDGHAAPRIAEILADSRAVVRTFRPPARGRSSARTGSRR